MMNILCQSVSIYVVIQAKLFYSNAPFLFGKSSSVREQENNNKPGITSQERRYDKEGERPPSTPIPRTE